jgi:hypothetical protein
MGVSSMATTAPSNIRSAADHVERIESALTNLKSALFEVVAVIHEAKEQLGDDVFFKDVAERLSISPSMVTKIMKISDCPQLVERRDQIPASWTTLYEMTLLRKSIQEFEGTAKGDRTFTALIDTGKIDQKTERNDIFELTKPWKDKFRAKLQKKRERDILALTGKQITNTTSTENVKLADLIARKETFRTFLITPPPSILQKWQDDAVFEMNIEAEMNIAVLRNPSQASTIQAFVVVPLKFLPSGLKILAASGFSYREALIPHQPKTGFARINDDVIILRGERGAAKKITIPKHSETGLRVVIDIAEQIGSKPRLHVFATEQSKDWVCLIGKKASLS